MEPAEMEMALRQIHALLGRGNHGPKENAACALSAICDLKIEVARVRPMEKALEEIQALDKCPLCGDNQDHHEKCAIYVAMKGRD